METRRSRRLQSKETFVNENGSNSPAIKKRKTAAQLNDDPPVKDEPKARARVVKSAYFDVDENDAVHSNPPAKRKARNLKSSYFESPDESEAESEYEPDDNDSDSTAIRPQSGRIAKKRKPTYESESEEDSSDAGPRSKPFSTKNVVASDCKCPTKGRRRTTVANKKARHQPESGSSDDDDYDEEVTPKPKSGRLASNPTQSSRLDAQKVKKSYESESDSSSDEFEKAPKSLLDLPKTECMETNSADVSDVSDDDADTSDTKPAEYFDFTSLVSQVTKATEAVVDQATVANASTAPAALEKEKDATSKETPEKKPKRGAKRMPKKAEVAVGDAVKPEQLEVCELLAMGEDTDLSAKDIKETVAKSSSNYEIPNQVEVLLDAPPISKKKRCNDLEIALRRRLNNIKRENQVYVHKVHVLCYIAHGNHLNSVLNSADVLGVALSLLPSDKCYPPKRMNMEYLEDLLNWFGKKIKFQKDLQVAEEPKDLKSSLQMQLQRHEARSKNHFCFIFLCLLRALGLRCRLVINLNVAPIKPTSDQLLPVNQKKDEEKPASGCAKKEKTPVKSLCKKKKPEEHSNKSATPSSSSKSATKKKESTYFKEETKPTRKSGRQTKSSSKYFEENVEDEEEEDDRSKSKSRKNKPKSKKKVEEPLVEEMSSTDESDLEDFVTPKKKIDRRVLSSEEDLKESKSSKGDNKAKQENKNNYWIEVYLEAEEKWFCVDVVKKSYHCIKQLYSNASHPVRYILAWNNDRTIKDVTRRYVPQYLSVTRKLRVDDSWWAATMQPYKPPSTPQNREEDEELDKILEELPIPASISECKNHPLYALKRHLLKFQGIYPPDAIPVGYIKGEPVYSRLCVQQLHGREMWIKEAKVVKLNETPYKIVKGRPQKTKFGTSEPPKDLELFGSWQVDDYVPPVAENGKVPRNAFGNVELFKPSMLPKGTVYLQIPGLQRIANKLNIDCAAAITGFEYSTNGWSYPVKDGFVVCEEFKDILLDAYNQEIEEAEKKERLKREERVYANWRRLIKGLFIREKLKRKYNFGDFGAGTSKTDVKKESK